MSIPATEFRRVAVIGVGLMGEIMVERAIAEGWPRDRLLLTHRREARRAELQHKLGGKVYDDNMAVAGQAEVIVVAVRPQEYEHVLKAIAPALRQGQILISIAAALSLAWLKARVPAGIKVVRVTPPPTAHAGFGLALLSANEDVNEADRLSVEQFVRPACEGTVWLPDHLTDPVTGVGYGILPYTCAFLATLIKAGVEQGIEPDFARKMVMVGMWATARMLHEGQFTPEELIASVTRDGLAQSSLRTMEANGFDKALRAGARALTGRSFELRGEPVPAEYKGFKV